MKRIALIIAIIFLAAVFLKPGPSFDPEINKCKYLKLQNTKNADGYNSHWQTSVSFKNGSVKLGLRNKYGEHEDKFVYQIYLDGKTYNRQIEENAWVYVGVDKPEKKGIYTVLYKIDGKTIACTGFEIK